MHNFMEISKSRPSLKDTRGIYIRNKYPADAAHAFIVHMVAAVICVLQPSSVLWQLSPLHVSLQHQLFVVLLKQDVPNLS